MGPTPAELCYTAALAILGGLVSFVAAVDRRGGQRVALFFEGSFAFRVGLVFLNERFNFLPQMHGGSAAWLLTKREGGLRTIFGPAMLDADNLSRLKFFPEALINTPALLLFENAPIMLNLTNCFVGAASGIVAFAYSVRLFGPRVGTSSLLIASFFPVAVSLSLFGLRDIMVYFFVLAEIFTFSWLVLRGDHRAVNLLGFAVSCLGIVILRPAFLPFLLVLPACFAIAAASRFVGAVTDRSRRMLLGGIVATGLVAAGAGVLLASYAVVLHSVRIHSLASPDILLGQYAAERAWRGYDPLRYQQAWRSSHDSADYSPANGIAAASAFLPAETYRRLPWPGRVLVQVVGFIVIPFPWQLNSPARVLAMLDSAFVVICVAGAWQARRMVRQPAWLPVAAAAPGALQTLCRGLLLTFLFSWLGYAMLVSNAGNAFRMRLSIVPFIVLGASIHAASAAWPARASELMRKRGFILRGRLHHTRAGDGR